MSWQPFVGTFMICRFATIAVLRERNSDCRRYSVIKLQFELSNKTIESVSEAFFEFFIAADDIETLRTRMFEWSCIYDKHMWLWWVGFWFYIKKSVFGTQIYLWNQVSFVDSVFHSFFKDKKDYLSQSAFKSSTKCDISNTPHPFYSFLIGTFYWRREKGFSCLLP